MTIRFLDIVAVFGPAARLPMIRKFVKVHFPEGASRKELFAPLYKQYGITYLIVHRYGQLVLKGLQGVSSDAWMVHDCVSTPTYDLGAPLWGNRVLIWQHSPEISHSLFPHLWVDGEPDLLRAAFR